MPILQQRTLRHQASIYLSKLWCSCVLGLISDPGVSGIVHLKKKNTANPFHPCIKAKSAEMLEIREIGVGE